MNVEKFGQFLLDYQLAEETYSMTMEELAYYVMDLDGEDGSMEEDV